MPSGKPGVVTPLRLRGVFAPATTPFGSDGTPDQAAMRSNLAAWSAAPLSGVLLFGSTGEGPLLDGAERTPLLAAAREVLPAGRLLLAGVFAESTRAAARLARAAADAGADAVLVAPPAYFRPQMTPDALRDHFAAVADESPVPVLLYAVPPRFSTVPLGPELVAELAEHANVAGIKDSSGDAGALRALVAACGERATVLAGSGALLLEGLRAGAGGGILAVALLAPELCAEVVRLHEAGDAAGAEAAQRRVGALHQAVVGSGVAAMKAALELLGRAGGEPRPPLRPAADGLRERVRTALVTAELLPGG